jgi:hypothetical protein
MLMQPGNADSENADLMLCAGREPPPVAVQISSFCFYGSAYYRQQVVRVASVWLQSRTCQTANKIYGASRYAFGARSLDDTCDTSYISKQCAVSDDAAGAFCVEMLSLGPRNV